MSHLLAIGGLAVACAGWVLVQRIVARQDPEQPGVEGTRCGACGCTDRCERTPSHPPPAGGGGGGSPTTI